MSRSRHIAGNLPLINTDVEVRVHSVVAGQGGTLAYSLYYYPSMHLATDAVLYLKSRVDALAKPGYQRNIAYSLSHWLSYCAAARLDPRRVTADDLIRYRDAMLTTPSQQTGEPNAPGTVALRVRAIASFYQWGVDRGWNLTAVDMLHSVRRSSTPDPAKPFPGVINQASSRLAPRSTRAETDIHPLAPAEQHRLLEALGPADGSATTASVRDRLIAEWMLFVGLRIEEVLGAPENERKPNTPGIRVHAINAMVADPDVPFGHCGLQVIGKFGKKRTVAVPNWLVIATQEYVQGERARNAASVRRPSPLLLIYSKSAGAKYHGKGVRIRRFQRIFERACHRIGLTRLIERHLKGTGDVRLVPVPRYSPHDLRHSYAVNEYFAAKAMGSSEPWKGIQAQLGHKNLQTTIDTYLAWVSAHSDWARNYRRSSLRSLAGVELG